jgi:hypothetical protein
MAAENAKLFSFQGPPKFAQIFGLKANHLANPDRNADCK